MNIILELVVMAILCIPPAMMLIKRSKAEKSGTLTEAAESAIPSLAKEQALAV